MIRLRAHVLVIAFYAVLALIITFPLILNLSSAFAGFVYGDAYEMAHHVWWFGYALRHGEPLFTQSLLAYPNGIDGALMWAVPLQYFPAWALALVLPLPAALNLQLLLSMALNGWAMWVLARYLITRTGDSAFLPALIAGAVYMLFPTMQGHLGAGHAGLIAAWGAPLYAYFLFRLVDEPHKARLIVGAALTFVISTGGHPLQTIYLLLPLTALFGIALLVQRKWRALAWVTVAAGLGAAVYGGVFLLPSLGSTFGTAAYTDEGGVVRYSADLFAAVTPSFFHPLFGRLAYTHQVLGVNIDEGAAFIGIAAAVLSVIAVIRVRAARWWMLVALIAYVLSLGALLKIFDQPVTVELEGYRSNIPLPFALVAELPVISLARTPGRFNFLTALAIAVLAGYGASWLAVRFAKWARSIRYAAVLALIGWIAFEYQLFFPLPTAPAALPDALRDLEGRAVLDLPYENLVTAKQALYLQTAHELPLIAGQVTRRTPVDPAELAILQETLDPALLDHVGADIVIVHREQDDEGIIETRAREHLGDPVYADAQFAVFERPNSPESAASAFAVIDAPPDPNQAAVYLYAPQSGWIDAAITLDTLDRAPELRLNGQRIFAWGADTLAGRADLPVWIPSAGFHTLSVTSANPCPSVIPESLECPPLGSLALDRDFRAEIAPTPVTMEHGIRLLAWRTNYLIGRAFHAYLRWEFDAPISDNDVRFVQVINAAGEIVAQEDRPLGELQAGDGWQDTVYLYRNGFPPGEYRIYAGWYHLSDDGVLTNYPLTGGAPEGSTGNSALIGVFTVQS